jgi:hypothetical protein
VVSQAVRYGPWMPRLARRSCRVAVFALESKHVIPAMAPRQEGRLCAGGGYGPCRRRPARASPLAPARRRRRTRAGPRGDPGGSRCSAQAGPGRVGWKRRPGCNAAAGVRARCAARGGPARMAEQGGGAMRRGTARSCPEDAAGVAARPGRPGRWRPGPAGESAFMIPVPRRSRRRTALQAPLPPTRSGQALPQAAAGRRRDGGAAAAALAGCVGARGDSRGAARRHASGPGASALREFEHGWF